MVPKPPKDAKLKRTVIGAAAVGVLVLAVGSYVYWQRTPQYSLHQIKQAIQTHDLALFRKHVDVEGLSSRLVDDLLASISEKNAQENGGLSHLDSFSS